MGGGLFEAKNQTIMAEAAHENVNCGTIRLVTVGDASG